MFERPKNILDVQNFFEFFLVVPEQYREDLRKERLKFIAGAGIGLGVLGGTFVGRLKKQLDPQK